MPRLSVEHGRLGRRAAAPDLGGVNLLQEEDGGRVADRPEHDLRRKNIKTHASADRLLFKPRRVERDGVEPHTRLSDRRSKNAGRNRRERRPLAAPDSEEHGPPARSVATRQPRTSRRARPRGRVAACRAGPRACARAPASPRRPPPGPAARPRPRRRRLLPEARRSARPSGAARPAAWRAGTTTRSAGTGGRAKQTRRRAVRASSLDRTPQLAPR